MRRKQPGSVRNIFFDPNIARRRVTDLDITAKIEKPFLIQKEYAKLAQPQHFRTEMLDSGLMTPLNTHLQSLVISDASIPPLTSSERKNKYWGNGRFYCE